jgi:hypothetical protein
MGYVPHVFGCLGAAALYSHTLTIWLFVCLSKDHFYFTGSFEAAALHNDGSLG